VSDQPSPPKFASIARPQEGTSAAFHYGYPARFFELVLGSTYGYVEGYWRRGDETLDEAMRNRFDYMCRKLYLKPGMKVAEVGSGWGYMTNLMARDHHVEVDTFGIVDNQNRALVSMASAWGVQDKVHLIEEDHRALAARPELYDRYVSLGVLEHAGRNCDAAWIDSIKTCLKPGGIGLLSVMTYNAPQETDFITQKYIFPGGHIPHIARVVDLLESRGLCIIDLENARRQYARAAASWLQNFKTNWDKIRAIDPSIFNERFRRTWFVYLMGASTAFASQDAHLSVQQIVFSKGRHCDYPLTRNFLYQ
jgi:cyclopropane-fatty-acyl-phospholipid synthase